MIRSPIIYDLFTTKIPTYLFKFTEFVYVLVDRECIQFNASSEIVPRMIKTL